MYLAAADDKYFLIADLPGEDEGAAALDFWKGFCHVVRCELDVFAMYAEGSSQILR